MAYSNNDWPLLISNYRTVVPQAGRLDNALRKYKEYLQHDPSVEHEHVTEPIDQNERDLAQQAKHESCQKEILDEEACVFDATRFRVRGGVGGSCAFL